MADRMAARADPAGATIVTGFMTGAHRSWEAGDLVVATEVRGPVGTLAYPAARTVAGTLRRRGMRVHDGPVAQRALPAAADASALALVLAVLDAGAVARRPQTADAPLAHDALRRAAAPLQELHGARRPHSVILAAPRAACAGVDRAVEIVGLALERFGPPIYVRKQIVHNRHVVGELERRGAVFVDEVGEVPRGATIVFSAHGVAPAVRAAAEERGLRVVDATCPLVAKVHAEARRFAASGHTVVLIGHAGHEEVAGTMGEAPTRTLLLDGVENVDALNVEDPERVAYLTQTTLAVDEADAAVAALRERFPALAGPPKDDICYATQNRQEGVKALAADCDLVLVIGSPNSSNSRRLVEVAERHGAPARLIEDESAIEPVWLAQAIRIGISAGASTPEPLVRSVVAAIGAFGPMEVEERRIAREDVRFSAPPIR